MNDDTISRQAAIDFIDAGRLGNPNEPRWSDNEVVNFLKSRPSAQPEIIRCKDCKYYQFADNLAFGFPVRRCEVTRFEDVDDDDFCSRGERKDDRRN